MIPAALSQRTQELAAAREPFVTATVVRVQHPTIVEPGSVALVLGDGTIEGFIGGVCAEHSVRAYSLRALETGEPLLLRILPEETEADTEAEEGDAGTEVASEEGSVTVSNPCLSGGAIEVFLEPAPPAPRVLVVGDTPVADAVRRLGVEFGLEPVAVDAAGPSPEAGDLALVVAAHGRDELQALRLALEVGVPYVGLVASHKRGAGVLGELRADGVPEELLERIDVPAGIAIGARTAVEIALSILAKIVSVRREAPDPGSATLAVDPICGMAVAPVESTLSVRQGDETVYFCSEGCRAKFEAQREHAAVGNT